jgi:hypothetical protein
VACSEDETIVLQQRGQSLVVIGEANTDDFVTLRIFNVKNSSNPQLPSSIYSIDGTVELTDQTGQIICNLQRSDSILWKSSVILEPQKEYSLIIHQKNGNSVQVTTVIPAPFKVSLEDNTLVVNNKRCVTLRIDDDEAGHYVIECITKLSQSDNMYLDIESSSKLTDNFIYNELPVPTRCLFLKSQKKSSIVFSVNLPSAYEDTYLQVRKVNAAYYNYLYNREVQHYSDEYLPIQTINSNYIGVWGGCCYRRVSITSSGSSTIF